jgi:hypothetical protein
MKLGLAKASGTVNCTRPGGKGTAKSTFTANTVPPNDLNFVGTFKYDFGKRGTLKGSFNITGSANPASPGPFTGTFKVKKGTGKLKKAHGSGKMNCTQSGITLKCTQRWTKGRL